MTIKLVVGLGNPGYNNTYHNAGSDILEKWKNSLNNIAKIDKNLYLYKENNIYILIYICPDVMNISGKNISYVYKKYKCTELIVIVDDLDTSPGVVRLKVSNNGILSKSVYANGHNGVRSIISHLPNIYFHKIVVGIGRPNNISVSDFVLSTRSNDYNNILYNDGYSSFVNIISNFL